VKEAARKALLAACFESLFLRLFSSASDSTASNWKMIMNDESEMTGKEVAVAYIMENYYSRTE
jgi:hypothetical protein